ASCTVRLCLSLHIRVLLWLEYYSCLFNSAAPSHIYTLSLHDALPISVDDQVAHHRELRHRFEDDRLPELVDQRRTRHADLPVDQDRKSTRLNSSHGSISYAVFCLKKKTQDGSYRAT